jgi:hypothetical protein
MGKLNPDKAAKLGDLLFRYMRARHCFKNGRLERPLPAQELAALINSGKTEFDEIYIEPDANPSIVFDGKADDVFEAVIKKRYRAIPFFDPQLVAAWRHYVVSDGPMPRRPEPTHSPTLAPINGQAPRLGADSLDLDLKTAPCSWSNGSGCNSSTTRRTGEVQVD